VWIGGGYDDVERSFDPVKYRSFSRRPALDILVPTVADPRLAPDGHHVLSVHAHCAPCELEGGWTDDERRELGDAVLARIAEHAPAVAGSVVAMRVRTPLDLEEDYGAVGGHLFHGEHAIDQLVVRPVPGCTGCRTPFEGLYLCGQGSHPGGGITCAPGALAAEVISGR
jgi:phytoene dehydrogenase-like protein